MSPHSHSMPYKDPEKRKAAMRESHKRYVAKNRDKVKMLRAEYHQKHLQERRADIKENNQRLGRAKTPRPKGPLAREELVVPMSRKWFLFTDQDGISRVYFTFKKGFTAEELLDILKHLTPAKIKSHTKLTKDIKTLSASHEKPVSPAPARPASRRSAAKPKTSAKPQSQPRKTRAGRSD